MIDKLFFGIEDYILKKRLKRSVKEAYSERTVWNINRCLEIVDSRFFSHYGPGHGSKLVIQTRHRDIHQLVDSINHFIGAIKNTDGVLEMRGNVDLYKMTLLDFCLDKEDRMANLVEVITYLKNNYGVIVKLLSELEGEVKQGYYFRKLEVINDDLVEILRALAIFKSNT